MSNRLNYHSFLELWLSYFCLFLVWSWLLISEALDSLSGPFLSGEGSTFLGVRVFKLNPWIFLIYSLSTSLTSLCCWSLLFPSKMGDSTTMLYISPPSLDYSYMRTSQSLYRLRKRTMPLNLFLFSGPTGLPSISWALALTPRKSRRRVWPLMFWIPTSTMISLTIKHLMNWKLN